MFNKKITYRLTYLNSIGKPIDYIFALKKTCNLKLVWLLLWKRYIWDFFLNVILFKYWISSLRIGGAGYQWKYNVKIISTDLYKFWFYVLGDEVCMYWLANWTEHGFDDSVLGININTKLRQY